MSVASGRIRKATVLPDVCFPAIAITRFATFEGYIDCTYAIHRYPPKIGLTLGNEYYVLFSGSKMELNEECHP